MDDVAYKRDQAAYKRIIDSYLAHGTDVEGFIGAFMDQWKQDGAKEHKLPFVAQTFAVEQGKLMPLFAEQAPDVHRFGRLMDRVFTSCDCYRPDPEGPIEISEAELRRELSLFRYIWWGEDARD